MVWNLFKVGFFAGWRQLAIACIAYVIQLLLAVIIGIQVYQVLEASIGNSLEIGEIISAYDHTVISDFLNAHGASVSPLFGQMRWLILIYILISVFVNGGLVACVAENSSGWKAFWKNAAVYFLPFLKIAFVFGVIGFIWILLMLVPVLSAFPTILESLSSEKIYFAIIFACLMVLIFGLIYLFNCSVLARLHYTSNPHSSFQAIKEGFRWTTRRWAKTTSLFLLYLLFLILVSAIYFLLAHFSGMVTPWLVVIFFLFQQAIILFRIIWRIMLYSSLNCYYQG